MMLLQAEILELKANPKGPEPRRRSSSRSSSRAAARPRPFLYSRARCASATPILAGPYYGRVKALINDLGQSVKEAGPSIPVKVLGSRRCAVARRSRIRRAQAGKGGARAGGGSPRQAAPGQARGAAAHDAGKSFRRPLPTRSTRFSSSILKGDVQGSVEAIVVLTQENRQQERSISISSRPRSDRFRNRTFCWRRRRTPWSSVSTRAPTTPRPMRPSARACRSSSSQHHL